jgi:hypothetical protein
MEAVEEEDAGTADCDFGEGMAWDDKCNAGVDIVACRNEGVTKLVRPPDRTLSRIFTFLVPPFFVFSIIG